jgi:hypothetical protein
MLVAYLNALDAHRRLSRDPAVESEIYKRLLQARDAYSAAIAATSRSTDAMQWADLHAQLAALYQNLSAERLRAGLGLPLAQEALKQAMDAYGGALQVYSREQTPERWAVAKIGLGGAILSSADIERFAESAAHFEAALEVLSRESHPELWGVATLALGLEYMFEWIDSRDPEVACVSITNVAAGLVPLLDAGLIPLEQAREIARFPVDQFREALGETRYRQCVEGREADLARLGLVPDDA